MRSRNIRVLSFYSINLINFINEITKYYYDEQTDFYSYEDFHNHCNIVLNRLQEIWNNKGPSTLKFWSKLDYEQYILPAVDEIKNYDEITEEFVPFGNSIIEPDQNVIEHYTNPKVLTIRKKKVRRLRLLFRDEIPLYRIYFNFQTILHDIDHKLIGESPLNSLFNQ